MNGQKPPQNEVNSITSNLLSTFKRQTTNCHKNSGSNSLLENQKDKKYLENKVIKLLNDMQVQSETIN